MYATYDFYTNTFYGNLISEQDFSRLASRASDFIDYYTLGRAAQSDAETPLAKACCAIAEAMQQDAQAAALANKAVTAALSAEGGELKSETVGSYSVSYSTSADYLGSNSIDAAKAARTRYAAIATEYLSNTGLLYRGGRLCG